MKARKMHGFLCQSHASTAVCIPGDPRSVIVPRRPDRTLILNPQARTVDLKYSRLMESRRLNRGDRKPPTTANLPTIARHETTTTTTPSKAVVTGPPPPPPPPLPTYGDAFQVVVMRVSIHCQGCAGKVKKHISKMEGVTSFSIDVESKRVTVRGHISPLGVLQSISKVKKAEFWQNNE